MKSMLETIITFVFVVIGTFIIFAIRLMLIDDRKIKERTPEEKGNER